MTPGQPGPGIWFKLPQVQEMLRLSTFLAAGSVALASVACSAAGEATALHSAAERDDVATIGQLLASGSRIDLVPWDQVPERPAGMEVRFPDSRRLRDLKGIVIPDRWQRIVADVCDWEAGCLGLRPTSSDAG